MSRDKTLLYECIGYIEEVVNSYSEALDVFRHLGFTEEELIEYEIRDFDLEDEIDAMSRAKEDVCGFDKEDALNERWGA